MYLLVLPSLNEGFPFVVLEAMAAGKPVVAFNSGGISEAAEDGITGLLISPKNTADLAEAIIFLLRNKTIAHKMGCMGRRRVAKMFDLKTMVEKTIRVYHKF
jgi:glycosyltransferase involved in cell wall biosynthesis